MQIGLILIALAFPLLELAVLIKAGQTIGFWWTMLLLVAAGIAGVLIIREQGIAATQRAMVAMREGRAPMEPVADSMLLMLAGTLLMIPGLITDGAGLLLLVPPLRRAFGRWALAKVIDNSEIRVETRRWEDPGDRPPPGQTNRPSRESGGGTVIEGEWERVEDPPQAPPHAPPKSPPASGSRKPDREPPRT